MNDLKHLLGQVEMQHAMVAPDQLDEARRARVRARVAASRTRRFSLAVAASAATVVALGGVVYGLAGLTELDPATSPAPSTTWSSVEPEPSPSASVTPTPAPAMPAFPGNVSLDPHLPSASAITAEAWNSAEAGWVLATYRETYYDVKDDQYGETPIYGPQVLYLISPEGDRYELTRVQSDLPVGVVSWRPGATHALAIESDGHAAQRWVVLDLVTGATRALDEQDVSREEWTVLNKEGLDSNVFALFAPDTVTSVDGANHLGDLLTPKTAPADPAVLDTARSEAQAVVGQDDECRTAIALENDVVVLCGRVREEADDQWVAQLAVFVDPSGTSSPTVVDVRSTFASEETFLWEYETESLGDTYVAVSLPVSADTCPSGRLAITAEGVKPLAGVEAMKANSEAINYFPAVSTSGSRVYTWVTGGCSGDMMPGGLVVDDLSTGEFVELVPLPADLLGSAQDSWTQTSLLSAFVVTED